jgi:hypothetical protein
MYRVKESALWLPHYVQSSNLIVDMDALKIQASSLSDNTTSTYARNTPINNMSCFIPQVLYRKTPQTLVPCEYNGTKTIGGPAPLLLGFRTGINNT